MVDEEDGPEDVSALMEKLWGPRKESAPDVTTIVVPAGAGWEPRPPAEGDDAGPVVDPGPQEAEGPVPGPAAEPGPSSVGRDDLEALRASLLERLTSARADAVVAADARIAGAEARLLGRLDDIAAGVGRAADALVRLDVLEQDLPGRLISVEERVAAQIEVIAAEMQGLIPELHSTFEPELQRRAAELGAHAEEIEALKAGSVTAADLDVLRGDLAASSAERLDALRAETIEHANSGLAEVTIDVNQRLDDLADRIRSVATEASSGRDRIDSVDQETSRSAAAIGADHAALAEKVEELKAESVTPAQLEELRTEISTFRSEVEEWLVGQISSVRAEVVEHVTAGLAEPVADLNGRFEELAEQVGTMTANAGRPTAEPDVDIEQRLEALTATTAEADRKSRQLEPLVELVRKDVARVWEALDALPGPVVARVAEPVLRPTPPTASRKRSPLRIALPAVVLVVLALALAWSLVPFRIANHVECGPALLGAHPNTAVRKGFADPKVECPAAGKNRLSESAAAALVAVLGGTGVYAFRRSNSGS